MKLEKLAKAVEKAKPPRMFGALYDLFVALAAAGETEAAGKVVGWMYGGVPAPKGPPTVFTAAAVDGFCAAAGLGERRGDARPLAERVKDEERGMRERLRYDCYGGGPKVDANWAKLDGLWKVNNRWRWIQKLAGSDEKRALAELETYLADWAPEASGPGGGDELVLALDLALRQRGERKIAGWLERHGHRVTDEAFFVEKALCLPAVAAGMTRGVLRGAVAFEAGAVKKALKDVEAAVKKAGGAAPARKAPKVPKVQKRRVTCEHSQFHLEHDGAALGPAYFQDRRESAQGMSLFADRVGVATPAETAYVDVGVSLGAAPKGKAAPDLDGAVQAVAFPLAVRGPLRLRSVAGDDEDEPVIVPPGSYDVLVRFAPGKTPKADAKAGLRVFRVAMTFLPEGALAAPRCFVLEDGQQPPKRVFVNR